MGSPSQWGRLPWQFQLLLRPSPCQALRASCPARCTTPLAAALRTPQDCRRGSWPLKVTLCSGARVPVQLLSERQLAEARHFLLPHPPSELLTLHAGRGTQPLAAASRASPGACACLWKQVGPWSWP